VDAVVLRSGDTGGGTELVGLWRAKRIVSFLFDEEGERKTGQVNLRALAALLALRSTPLPGSEDLPPNLESTAPLSLSILMIWLGSGGRKCMCVFVD